MPFPIIIQLFSLAWFRTPLVFTEWEICMPYLVNLSIWAYNQVQYSALNLII